MNLGRAWTLILSSLVSVWRLEGGHLSGRNGGVDATQDDKVRGPELEGLAEALPYSGAHSRCGNTSLTSVGPCCLLVPINPQWAFLMIYPIDVMEKALDQGATYF